MKSEGSLSGSESLHSDSSSSSSLLPQPSHAESISSGLSSLKKSKSSFSSSLGPQSLESESPSTEPSLSFQPSLVLEPSLSLQPSLSL